MEKWKTIKSEPLVDSRWVKVRKDSVDLPNGQHIDDFYAISLNDVAAIVALDDAGNIVLKKEYRYCLDRDLIEVPAGSFERGGDGLAVAKRELLEETGYASDDWQYIGATVESSAKLTNYMQILHLQKQIQLLFRPLFSDHFLSHLSVYILFGTALKP